MSDRLDPARLAAVRATGLLDTEIEDAFDRITRLAVQVIGVPAAFISLVDEHRDFYKSACGFGEPLATTRQITGPTFCHLTIQSDQPLVIPDTAADPRYRDVPTVRSLGVAAYVGIPLIVADQVIGAFCAVDYQPRAWTARDVGALRDLTAIAVREIELRSAGRRSERRRSDSDASRIMAELAHGRLAEIFRQAPAFIAVLQGRQHVFELVNEEYCRLVGRRDGDLVGRTVADALPEIRAQGFVTLLDRVLDSGEPFIGQDIPVEIRRTTHSDSHHRFITFVYQPLMGSDGTPSGIFVLGVDVTKQVQAREAVDALNEQLRDQTVELEAQAEELSATNEELEASTEDLMERTAAAELARDSAERAAVALSISEARYRALTEAVPVQVWTARPDGSLDFVSTQASSYFGASEAQVLGSGWTTFVHPNDLPAAAARWAAALASGEPYQAEFRLRSAQTGDYRWHLARALPHRDPNGTILGWIGSNTDVEGERQARSLAEAANHAKSEFLAMMSHELRTPLNAIGGYTELLEMEVRGPVTATQRIDLERIQRSQRHLLGLINGILNYARVDAGMMPFAVERVSMDEVLGTCQSLTMPQARTRNIALDYPATRTRLAANADREKVHQIVLNLLSNAIKFTKPGGHISVRCEAHEDTIVLQVADTGAGIPVDQLQRIFQPFVQLDGKLTGDRTGTGLGLAISRELARGMGGDVTVASVVGEGSTFSLSLPAFPT